MRSFLLPFITFPLLSLSWYHISAPPTWKHIEHEEHRTKSVTEICRLAGYATKMAWYRALKDERFAAVVHTFDIKEQSTSQRLLEVLQQEENRRESVAEICRLAGCTSRAWYRALADEQFVRAIKAFNIPVRRHTRVAHLEVTLAANVEEELTKDVWDIRRLKPEYPKHRPPARYESHFPGS